jgi:peptidoglycan/LPS O-acetylase OafA/YrhL
LPDNHVAALAQSAMWVSVPPMNASRKYAGLEVIRAIAALIVLYNHVFTFGLIQRNLFFSLPAQYATEAVMIFFVLSGVVITLSVEKKRYSAFGGRLPAEYLTARFVRIYPIFIVGLLLAVIAERVINGTWLNKDQIAGNAFFLQSLPGYLVGTPQYNLPLWTLSYEMSFYVLFALCLLWKQFLPVWFVAAVVAASVFYPPSPTGRAVSQFVSVLALSIPWIMGHLIANWRECLPRIPVSFGIACLIIGLVYARCPITADYYDIFRLTTFALCCCPLMLAMIQKDNRPHISTKTLLLARIVLATIALLLLWKISTSLLLVKIGLTIAAVTAAFMPPTFIDECLLCLSWALSGLVYVGSISYAIYAIHAPIIALTAYLGQQWGVVPEIIVFTIVILAISHIMERIVQPMLSAMSRRYFAQP